MCGTTGTERSFDGEKLLHREAFTHRSFYTASFYTEKLLHRRAFTRRSFYTQKPLLYTQQAFTQRIFYTEKPLHREAFTHKNLYTEKLLHTHTHKPLAQRREKLQLEKTGCRRQSKKKTILKHFSKVIFKRKISSAQIEKICWQIAITALTQPFQYDFPCPAATDNGITHAAAAPRNLDAASTVRSGETELQTAIELRATASEIAALKPDLDANHLRQNGENLLTNHYRSLGAATPIRFPMSSCKKTISITHAAAAPSNLDATSTMRLGTSRGYITRMSLHTWQQNMITFIQGDLQ